MSKISILRVLAFACAIAVSQLFGAEAINVHGKVSDKAGKGIPKAIVELLGQGLKDTTENDGAYSIIQQTSMVLPSLAKQNERISFNNGVLELTINKSSLVK